MANAEKFHHKKLTVVRLLAPIVSSRDGVDILEKSVKKVDVRSVDLDFTNIKFVSRSAAHALLLMKENIRPKRNISFINTNEEVANMLRMVAANRAVSKKQKPNFNPEKITAAFLFKKALA